jgi:hypothetical protein
MTKDEIEELRYFARAAWHPSHTAFVLLEKALAELPAEPRDDRAPACSTCGGGTVLVCLTCNYAVSSCVCNLPVPQVNPTSGKSEVVKYPDPPYELLGDSGKIYCPMCDGEGMVDPPSENRGEPHE